MASRQLNEKPQPAYTAGSVLTYYSQFTSTPNFAQKYGKEIGSAHNISLVTHCNVTSLQANESATVVNDVMVRALDGHWITVKARYVVVCCGGIESARLLLLSDSVEPQGIGNGNDLVGRYFQDHPGVGLPVTPLLTKPFHDYFDSFRKNGFRHSVKIVTSDALQRRERINHIGGEIFYPAMENDSVRAAKEMIQAFRRPLRLRKLLSSSVQVARNPHRVVAAAYRHYVKGIPPSVGSSKPMLGVGGEQEPNSESRVTLGADVDAVGKRRTVLDWRLTRNDVRSMDVYLRVVAAEWKRLGIASINIDDAKLGKRLDEAGDGFVDANHHMGTTRMGDKPESSVVDSRCRVHGYKNLYIGSASTFPTGGFSNPTLTVLALCLRIADELKQQLLT